MKRPIWLAAIIFIIVQPVVIAVSPQYALEEISLLPWALILYAILLMFRTIRESRKRLLLIAALGPILMLGVIAAGRPHLIEAPYNHRVGHATGDIGGFNSALELYQVDVQCRQYPATMPQLISDNTAGWVGPYLATIPNDPWGNAYIYSSNGSSYTITSVHDAKDDVAETIRYVSGKQVEVIPPNPWAIFPFISWTIE